MSDAADVAALGALLTARGYVAVPLVTNATGHFEIAESTLDGAPVRLLLDTGASHTVVDGATAERLGLATAASELRGGGVGGVEQVLTTTTVTLGLGPATCANIGAYVMDLSHVSAALVARGGTPIDGAVGGDLLRPAEAVIDYARNTLFLMGGAPATA
jgi:predicted aspartyl protease